MSAAWFNGATSISGPFGALEPAFLAGGVGFFEQVHNGLSGFGLSEELAEAVSLEVCE